MSESERKEMDQLGGSPSPALGKPLPEGMILSPDKDLIPKPKE